MSPKRGGASNAFGGGHSTKMNKRMGGARESYKKIKCYTSKTTTIARGTKAPNKQLALTKSISATGDVLDDSNCVTDEIPFDEMATMTQIGRPTVCA